METKHKWKQKVLTGALATSLLVLPLSGCGQATSDSKADASEAPKTEEMQQETGHNFKNINYSVDRYLSYLYEGKSTEMKDFLGIDRDLFEQQQIDFFAERAGSVTPIEYPLVIQYENFSEVYQPEQIKTEYATAMVAYFEQIQGDYSIEKVEKTSNGAEVTVKTKGIALNALASQANEYMDSLIGFDQNMALSKYPSDEVQKANAVLQFWAMGQLYKQGNKAPLLDEPVEYTLFFEKDVDGNYKPSDDAMKDVYSGSSKSTYEDGKEI
ncbi:MULTISPECIES: hypothetical protein [Listeria]|uniref:hypothetical protein n=1 Tax=Listeria TaxID=1637 RepID=UPI000B588F58|nr:MULTISPECIES: hypothetical protein [Listeria]